MGCGRIVVSCEEQVPKFRAEILHALAQPGRCHGLTVMLRYGSSDWLPMHRLDGPQQSA